MPPYKVVSLTVLAALLGFSGFSSCWVLMSQVVRESDKKFASLVQHHEKYIEEVQKKERFIVWGGILLLACGLLMMRLDILKKEGLCGLDF